MNIINKENIYLNTQSILSMRSSGYYSQKTMGAKIAIDSTLTLLKNALNEIPKLSILRMADLAVLMEVLVKKCGLN